MSAYANDRRVQPDPDHDKSWLVDGHIHGVTYNVVEGDDGSYYAYTSDGRLLYSISGRDFDTVVYELIGAPR